jgi:DNA-directed RNA polymerase specialized sigma24 family protein
VPQWLQARWDSEDAVSEAIVSLLAGNPTRVMEDHNPLALLVLVARRRLSDVMRARKTQPLPSEPRDVARLPGREPAPHDQLVAEETYAAILGRAPSAVVRQLIEDRVAGCTPCEAARRAGLGLRRAQRALQALRPTSTR